MQARICVATNTFNANRISQADYGAEHLVREINIGAARIIREAIDARDDGVPRFIAGAMGPTNKTLSLSPDVEDPGFREVSFDDIVDVYREQAAALLEGGADFILIETVFDTLNCKAAIMAVKQLERELGCEVPLMISLTLTDLSGRNLSGHTVEAFWYTVRHAKLAAIGLNCSFGADQLRPHVQLLSDIADTLVLAYPNAGLPNELGEYDEAPETTRRAGRAMGGEQARQHSGWVLRLHARTHRCHGQGGGGSVPAHALRPPIPGMRLAGLEPFTIAA